MNKKALLILAVFAVAGCAEVQQEAQVPVKMIIETDMGNDIDDALALALALRAVDNGQVELLAVGCHKNCTTAAAFTDAVCTYYGHPEVPVAMSHTPVQEFTDYVDYTACEKDFAKTVSEYAEPVALYRKILSAQPDKSVTFVSLGFGTTLAQLLESAPDEYSPLNGVDLVAQKTKGLSVMAGSYGEKKRFAGFTSIYEESSDEAGEESENVLPQLNVGDPVTIQSIDSEQHFTQPPARYTEASLVRMLDEKGIGRPSTYAPTITTIIARGYVTRENKRLFATELGRMVTSVMTQYFAEIADTEFTAQMETRLDEIEEGKVDWKQVLREFYPGFEKTLKQAEKTIEKVEIHDEPSNEICEKCGSRMVYRVGRFGKFLACPNFPDCRNTKPVLNYINVKCPKCGGRLLEKMSKKNRRFYGC